MLEVWWGRVYGIRGELSGAVMEGGGKGVEVWWNGVHGYIRRLRGDIMEVVEVWWSRYLG